MIRPSPGKCLATAEDDSASNIDRGRRMVHTTRPEQARWQQDLDPIAGRRRALHEHGAKFMHGLCQDDARGQLPGDLRLRCLPDGMILLGS